jgi:hypothetical protein
MSKSIYQVKSEFELIPRPSQRLSQTSELHKEKMKWNKIHNRIGLVVGKGAWILSQTSI